MMTIQIGHDNGESLIIQEVPIGELRKKRRTLENQGFRTFIVPNTYENKKGVEKE